MEDLKRELAEARDQQAATAEILAAISSSPTDPRGAFERIAASAARLCDAYDATIHRVEGGFLQVVAHHGSIPAGATFALKRGFFIARAVLDRRTIHIADLQAETDEYPEGSARARSHGFRTILAVPLMREGEAIGVIAIRRIEVRLFSGKQIALLETFASQAVIAIENTRLFEAVQARTRELTESLRYQTATADVLSVISSSKSDVRPVFEAIVKSAAELFDPWDATITTLHDGQLHWQATAAARQSAMRIESVRSVYPIPFDSDRAPSARAMEKRQIIEITDAMTHETPEFVRRAQAAGGFRSVVFVPLVREDKGIGTINLTHSDAGYRLTEKQRTLVQTFAEQAVIAIENARLLNELRESLQHQIATADVLKVISRSTFNLQSVLDTLVESAATLCEAEMANIWRPRADAYRLAASHGVASQRKDWLEMKDYLAKVAYQPGRGSIVGRALLARATVQIDDIRVDPEYDQAPMLAIEGMRTFLAVPLMREGDPIGVMVLVRATVRPFTIKQIELVETFADQAVIAIENARLFEEVQERTRELAKTVDDLEIASQHKSQFVANMSHELRTPLAAILGYAELMQDGFYESQGPRSLEALTRIRSNGKHLLGLINTVLDIAKIESGQFTLNMAEYAIESIVETVRSATEALAQNKKLVLKTEVAKSLPAGVGDEQRLTQVLLNLVGNAIKFTDTGEVRVTAKVVDGHFNVSVADTGPGIPAEQQTRIFDQFHQVDSSTTKAKGGTGLGLSIAKQIVEMHGGRIWVESTLGEGSTFQMELPTRAEFRKSTA